MTRGWFAVVVLGLACSPCWGGRIAPDAAATLSGPGQALARDADAQKNIDFIDGDDPSIRSHWALLVAGSAGWGNYRHQADVFHAYQVLRSGGYRQDHIVVMAYDDIANNPENPMPGKVFNRPGGPDVYAGIKIDYRGEDVNAANFLAVLEGNTAAVANKGSGRVIASGPNDKVFLFYSDHGAAGVLGMPSGPFLYADELLKSLRNKFHKQGFKEMVLYIEACESGSMFEGLLDDNMAAYVTTAANAYESSWATYCPEFFITPATDSSSGSDDSTSSTSAPSTGRYTADQQQRRTVDADRNPASRSSTTVLQQLLNGLQYVQRLFSSALGVPTSQHAQHDAAMSVEYERSPVHGVAPSPQFFTCLGDLYSVAWMEDAESSDLTQETLLQQYKLVKKRTSQNFTYDQGSHVMQYGALDIDKEFAGDYQGMLHNGSVPPSPSYPGAEWIAFEEQQLQQQQPFSNQQQLLSSVHLQQHSSVTFLTQKLTSRHNKHKHKKHKNIQQRDADLLPLIHAAQDATSPTRRAAAAVSLQAATSARQALEAASRAAVASLIKQPDVGYIMLANLGWLSSNVLRTADPATLKAFYGDTQQMHASQQIQQIQEPAQASMRANSVNRSSRNGILGDVEGSYVEALMGPLPGREGQPLVDSWDCLRGMVKAWEGQCGALDQYGMKQTRLFANLCNAGVQPHALEDVLGSVPCKA